LLLIIVFAAILPSLIVQAYTMGSAICNRAKGIALCLKQQPLAALPSYSPPLALHRPGLNNNFIRYCQMIPPPVNAICREVRVTFPLINLPFILAKEKHRGF
jgi:hypothetical protein